MSRAAQILLDAAMGYQAALDAKDPDRVVNDEYFEQQAEAQVQALAQAGLLVASNDEVDQIEAGAKLVADAFFDDMRLWFTFTDPFRDLGGPHRARAAAAAVAARALAEAGWVTPQASSAERDKEELVHDVARAIRDAYEELPDGTTPEFTNVSDWYGEARAALAAIRGEAA